MREVELKFLLDEGAAKTLRARLDLPGLNAGELRFQKLRSIYFDTEDHRLRKAGMSLRLRRDGRRWVQTLKARAGLHGGLSQAIEVECPAPGRRLDLNAIPDADVREDALRTVAGGPLLPVCETAIDRLVVRLSPDRGGVAELAIDSGRIVSGERAAVLHEAEIELIEGQAGILFDIARLLFPHGGLRFSTLPKSARGYLLAEEGFIEPPLMARPAIAVALEASQTVETAARDLLRECLDQIAVNIGVVRETDDPEGPHQLRIGLRRLRSALAVFGPALDSPMSARLAAEAQWLGQQVGRLRDLEVAVREMLRPEAEANTGEAGLGRLADRVALRARSERVALRGILVETRAQAFLIELARFVETRGWLNVDDIDQTARLAQPVGEYAGEALRVQWKKAARRAKGLERLSSEERHDLRKELKKLRYAVEFLSPLFPAKRSGPFIGRLRRLQAVFGASADAGMLLALMNDQSAEWTQHAYLRRAAGWVAGAYKARAELSWPQVRSAWDRLKDAKAFWK